jgi:hypothetical protein
VARRARERSLMRLSLSAVLVAIASVAAASEGVAPTPEVLSATDVVVVGVLRDVTKSADRAPGSGRRQWRSMRFFWAPRVLRQLTLRWNGCSTPSMDPRAVDRRLICFFAGSSDGHAEAFGNAWHFAADQCEPIRELQRRLQSFTGVEADERGRAPSSSGLRLPRGTSVVSLQGRARSSARPRGLARIKHNSSTNGAD